MSQNTPWQPGEAPNLDDFTDCVRDYRHARDVLGMLAHYLDNKAYAVEAHLVNPADALIFEKQCDRIYDELPKWARW